MGRALKRQAPYVSIPGVGMPKTLRFSGHRVYSFMFDTAATGSSIILNLLNPVAQPTVGTIAAPVTSVTNMTDPQDYTRFMNSQLYRKCAVYAATIKAFLRMGTTATTENLVYMGFLPGGDTLATSPDLPGFPINWAAMSIADQSEYIRNNPGWHSKYLQCLSNSNSVCTFFRELNFAEELGIKKEELYTDNWCSMVDFSAGVMSTFQPATTVGSSNTGIWNKLWLIIGEIPTWYIGSSVAASVNTPGTRTGAEVYLDLQITYHMLMFNDVANDVAIADPAAPAPEEEEKTEDGAEWSEDDAKTFNTYVGKLSNSMKKIKMSNQ